MTALVLVVLAAADAGTQVPDERARGRLFDTLVSDIRRLHVFTPQIEANLGRKWDEDLPALKDELLRADTAPKLGLAYTTQRINWPVMLASGQQFGFIALAFSDEVSGKTGQSVEAVPVEPTKLVEPSFENQGTYDALVLDAAIAELEARAKAKR
jgi:hypothetical protein